MPATLDQLHSQFSRFKIADDDLAECQEYLTAYAPTLPASIQRGLLTAAVIAYSRPFKISDTGGRSTPSLPANVTRCLDVLQRAFHKRVLFVRDEAIAHSAFHRRATRRTSGSATGFATAGKAFDVRAEIEDVPYFLEVATVLRRYCISTLFQLNRAIIELE